MVPDSLRRRIEIPRRPIVQHARITRNTEEAVRQATRLERRISNIERLVGFLTDVTLGLISAFIAIVGAAFADSNASWQDTICAGLLAFLISMWMANFLFPNATRLVFEIALPSSPGALAAIQRHAKMRWRISKRSGMRSRTNPFWGAEQKLKRRCSLDHTRLERFVTASPSPEGTPIFGLNWFHDRAWPTAQ